MTSDADRPGHAEAFQAFLRRAHDGDQDAASALYREFAEAVLRAVRRFLTRHHPLRSQGVDTDWIAQELWCHFFKRVHDGQTFESPQHLENFFLAVARNVICNLHRRYAQAQKRALSRTEPLEPYHGTLVAHGDAGADPVDLASCEDEWHSYLSQRSEFDCAVLRAIRAGESTTEVACRFEVSVRTIQRIVERFREWMSEEPSPRGEC